jgi:cytoskeletal protein CcmA (bactofilin family)
MATKMDNTVNVNEVSRISAGTLVKGEIHSPGDIRIDGSFDGKLISKGRVVVGEKATLTGDVICQNMDFCGKMKGNFYVKDTLTLKAGCTVEGDLHIKRLQVELGARFNGNCHMMEEAEFEKITGTAPAPQPQQPVVKK